jgi:2-polyprenyl-6-methoxyphenol hydroxylase-like FAD-dependent oxidoreductase
MVSLRKALVVGGGIGGMCAALRLRELGAAVDLVDRDPHWRATGAGITITGPTLRAFKALGLLQDIQAHGFFSPRLRQFAADGSFLGEVAVAPLEDGLPAAGGIMRPVLHRLLSERVRAHGVTVRLGVEPLSFREGIAVVDVGFSDGQSDQYGLVVAADGCYSATRTMLFPEAPVPTFTGQGTWRAVAARPERVDCGEFYSGSLEAGVTPCSQQQMYLYLLDNVPHNPRYDSSQLVSTLRSKLTEFGGTIGTVRDGLGEHSAINYRPLETVLVPRPWHHGRIVLIGDAAHATTPHLACGAGLAVEDALVLSEELARADTLAHAFVAFEKRRFERCRLVVESSLRLGQLEQQRAPAEEQYALFSQATEALAQPI